VLDENPPPPATPEFDDWARRHEAADCARAYWRAQQADPDAAYLALMKEYDRDAQRSPYYAGFTVYTQPVATSNVSDTNPRFSGTAVLENYQPQGGSVGDMLTAPVTFQAAGTLSRVTAT